MKKYNNWYYEFVKIGVPSLISECDDYFEGIEILGYDFWEKAKSPNFEVENLKIPEFIKKVPVISIWKWAFEWKNKNEFKFPIKVLHLSNNLLCVKERAFKFRGIKEIKFWLSLRIVKECSFLWNELESLKFPESLLEIKYGAFEWNPLQKIDFGITSKIKRIWEWAFTMSAWKYKGTPSTLKQVTLNKSTQIHSWAFQPETKINRISY